MSRGNITVTERNNEKKGCYWRTNEVIEYYVSAHFCFKQILHAVIKSILKFHCQNLKNNVLNEDIFRSHFLAINSVHKKINIKSYSLFLK